MSNFDERTYNVSLRVLTEHGVPYETADAASKVVASDNPKLENNGRSPDDQAVVNEAVKYLNCGGED